MAGTVDSEERRIDIYDSQACTLDEVKKKYLLSEVEILDYWETMMIRIVYSESCKPAASSSSAADAQRLARFRKLLELPVAADNSKQDAIKPKNPPPDEMRENPQDAA